MKILATILLLLMPIITFGQNFPNMNEQDMQKMKQGIQKMQTCMQNVDQEKLKEIQKQSEKFESEIKSLCSSAKRDEAQKKAILFTEKTMKNPVIETLKKCSEILEDAIPKTYSTNEDIDYSKNHICDEINKNPISIF